VTFLDCAGIGALVGVHNAAVHAGCQMRVSHPQPFVRRVLDLTGLLDVFTAATVEPSPPLAAPEHPPGPRAIPAAVADPHRLPVAA